MAGDAPRLAEPLTGAAARRLAELIPDEARWIDLSGALLSGRCKVWVADDPQRGLAARSIDHSFVSVYGEPSDELAAAVRSAVAGGGSSPEVLADPDHAEWLAECLPGWTAGRAIFHRLPEPVPKDRPAGPAPDGFEIVRLAPDALPPAPDLSGLPSDLRSEIATYLAQVCPLYAARVAGESRLVSFCASPLASRTLWDTSVDTLEEYRRRGLAAACFVALASWMARERDLEPVWGAVDDNVASLALAARLGFEPVAELAYLIAPRRTSSSSGA